MINFIIYSYEEQFHVESLEAGSGLTEYSLNHSHNMKDNLTSES